MKRTHYKASIPINDIWDKDRFFYIDDIRKTCKSLNLHSIGKKNNLLENIRIHLKHQQKSPYLQQICLIQQKWREYRDKRKWRGPGFLRKRFCTNQEDFYTLNSITELDDTFFFSYQDINNVIFFFDIRSFERLITINKQNTLDNVNTLNPFTRQIIPDYAIKEYKTRKEYLESHKLWKPIEDDTQNFLTQEQKLKLRVVDVITQINMLDVIAGGVQIDWFMKLSTKQLKKYYSTLEDIWNYRAGLSKNQKLKIVPDPEKIKKMFPYQVKQVINSSSQILNYKRILLIIMNAIEIMISSSAHTHHKITAGNYVIIALTEVSPQIAAIVPWLSQNNY